MNQGKFVDVNGSLLASGTAEGRIYFTSAGDDTVGGDLSGPGYSEGTPGAWEALYLNSHDAGVTLEHVEVRFAGNRASPGSGGNQVTAVLLDKADAVLTDVRVMDVESTGIFIEGGSPELTRVSVDGAGGHGFVSNLAATPSLANLSATRIALFGFALPGGDVAGGTRTWDFGGLAVQLTGNIDIAAGTTLTIVQGQIVKSSAGILLDVNGSLIARGTAN